MAENNSAADRLILGEGVAYSTDPGITGLNNNVVIVGGSGSGKTMSFVEPRLLEAYNSSFIVPVTKQRVVDMYAPMLKRRGYDVQVLDFVDLRRSDCCYDPLQFVESYSDIRFLAEAIVMSDERKLHSTSDPYWDQAAISLLCAEIAYILMVKPNASMADLLRLHDHLRIDELGSQIKTSLDSNFAQLAKLAPECFALNCWRSFRELPIKTASCVFGALNVTIDTLFTPELRSMIATKPCVEVEEVARRKTVLFIRTSPVNPALHALISLFYGQAIKLLFEFAEQQPNGKLPLPVEFLADDFATGAPVNHFEQYISIFREKRISATLLLQSESQLARLYNESRAREIIDNMDTYVFTGGMDYQTAKNVSLRADLPLEDVFSLPVGDILIFRRGQRPIRTRRYDIRANETYQRVAKEYEEAIERKQRAAAR